MYPGLELRSQGLIGSHFDEVGWEAGLSGK